MLARVSELLARLIYAAREIKPAERVWSGPIFARELDIDVVKRSQELRERLGEINALRFRQIRATRGRSADEAVSAKAPRELRRRRADECRGADTQRKQRRDRGHQLELGVIQIRAELS